MKNFKKILIANRGEIATRIIRASNELGIKTVAIYSKQDAHLDFIKKSSEAVMLEGNSIPETYLNMERIIDIALKLNVDAIHPGYGFLSENAEFAKKCTKNNLVFIGPSAESIELMGDKIRARKIAEEAGVPVLSGITGNPEEILKTKSTLEYPILIKASAGGGGKGMKIVSCEEDLEEALWIAKQQALTYFGDDTIYIEKYLENPKHIEVQVFGDDYGNYVHLFERECSIQRRHQKIIEESPAQNISIDLREKLTAAALKLSQNINYKNAGTIEFLVQGDKFYFLEMNTRIQVEHPVTEETTGIDLVKEQILVAQGYPLSFKQQDIKIGRHSIQCRIYAEDPENNFRPSPGIISLNLLPDHGTYRIDTICNEDRFTVPPDFDPMLTKLISSGKSRGEAIAKMRNALDSYIIHGICSNIQYLREIINETDFKKGDINTNYIESHHQQLLDLVSEKKANIPLFIPLIGTYFFSFQENSEIKDIWNAIGRWKVIDSVSGLVEGKNITFQILSNSENSKKIYVDNQWLILSYSELNKNTLEIICDEKKYHCVISQSKQNNLFEVTVNGLHFIIEREDILKKCSLEEYLSQKKSNSSTINNGIVKSPLNGKAIKVNFRNGDKVVKGDTLLIIESMKTENKVIAEQEGVVSEIFVLEGEQVKGEQLLLRLN